MNLLVSGPAQKTTTAQAGQVSSASDLYSSEDNWSDASELDWAEPQPEQQAEPLPQELTCHQQPVAGTATGNSAFASDATVRTCC